MAKLDSMGEQVDALQAEVKSIRAEVERVRGIWWAANWTLRFGKSGGCRGCCFAYRDRTDGNGFNSSSGAKRRRCA